MDHVVCQQHPKALLKVVGDFKNLLAADSILAVAQIEARGALEVPLVHGLEVDPRKLVGAGVRGDQVARAVEEGPEARDGLAVDLAARADRSWRERLGFCNTCRPKAVIHMEGVPGGA